MNFHIGTKVHTLISVSVTQLSKYVTSFTHFLCETFFAPPTERALDLFLIAVLVVRSGLVYFGEN